MGWSDRREIHGDRLLYRLTLAQARTKLQKSFQLRPVYFYGCTRHTGITAAFIDACNGMVRALKHYEAQNVNGGLGRGGTLKVN